MEEEVETKEEAVEEKATLNDLVPMDKLREIVKNANLPQPQDDFNSSINDSFKEYLGSEDEEKDAEIKKQNKKRFKVFSKGRARTESDKIATDNYKTRYDRETWFYKRHRDTIDRYVKKEDKQTKKTNSDANVVVLTTKSDDEDVLRVGYFKMLIIVWFDLIVCTILGNILFAPIHLLRFVSELFFKMRKSVAITVGIIVGIVIVVVGLILGVNYIMQLARGLS